VESLLFVFCLLLLAGALLLKDAGYIFMFFMEFFFIIRISEIWRGFWRFNKVKSGSAGAKTRKKAVF